MNDAEVTQEILKQLQKQYAEELGLFKLPKNMSKLGKVKKMKEFHLHAKQIFQQD